MLMAKEGTTQGDPLAMPFYALATVPLIQKLTAPVTQVWYADHDAAACGKVLPLACDGTKYPHWVLSLVTSLMQKKHALLL